MLGAPQEASWPELRHLPHWRANSEDVCRTAASPEYSRSRLAATLREGMAAVVDRMSPQAVARQRAELGLDPSAAAPLQQSFMLSDAGLDLLHRMLEFDPKRRITAEQALGHAFFTEEDPPVSLNVFSHGGQLLVRYPKRAQQHRVAAPVPQPQSHASRTSDPGGGYGQQAGDDKAPKRQKVLGGGPQGPPPPTMFPLPRPPAYGQPK